MSPSFMSLSMGLKYYLIKRSPFLVLTLFPNKGQRSLSLVRSNWQQRQGDSKDVDDIFVRTKFIQKFCADACVEQTYLMMYLYPKLKYNHKQLFF